MARWEGVRINEAKVRLADAATSLLHGEEALETIHKTANSLFVAQQGSSLESLASLQRVSVSRSAGPAWKVADLLLLAGLTESKAAGRRIISGGGVKANDVKVSDEFAALTVKDFEDGGGVVKLSAGKKKHVLVELV